ncbi:MAG: hypothetical protein SFH39_10035 [Candidatus Magnetobacterium sp. LHC-1]
MTVEDIPRIASTLARIAIVDVLKSDIDQTKLSNLQVNRGLLTTSMSSYIMWLQPQLDAIKAKIKTQFAEIRDKAYYNGVHRRMPEMVAFMHFGLEIMLDWMVSKGVITADDKVKRLKSGHDIFIDLAEKQSKVIATEDPVEMFKEIINTLLTQKKIWVEPKNGKGEYSMKGEMIGYDDDYYYFFLPRILWKTVTRFCTAEGSQFPLKINSLYALLKNRGVVIDEGKNTTVVESIKGKNLRLLKVKKDALHAQNTDAYGADN